MKRIFKILLFIFLALFIFFSALGINILTFGNSAKPKKGDCIIILGCSVYGKTPSPFLAERLNEGIRLYNNGYANKIIVTGGKGQGEDISEGEAMKYYLIKNGIPENNIIVENKSTSTLQNLKFSKIIMENNNFKSGIIVSNKYHLKRASLMAKKYEIEASYKGVYLSEYKLREFAGLIREIPAIVKFYIFGY